MSSAPLSRRSARGPHGGLGRRIFLWMLAFTLLPVGLVALQGYHCARQAVVDSVRADLSKVAAARRSRLETWLQERRNDLSFLAANPCTFHECCAAAKAADGGGAQRMCNVLDQVRRQVAAYEGIAVYDASWKLMAASGSGREAGSVRAVFGDRLGRAMEPITGPVGRRSDGRLGFEMGLRLSGRDALGETYLVASVNLQNTLDPILKDLEGLGSSGAVYLVDGRGVYIAGSDPALVGRPVSSTGVRRALAGASGAGEYADFRGEDVVGGFAALPELGWAVIVERDRDEALHWLDILAWRAIVVALLTVAAVGFFSTRVSRRLSRPIRELAEVSHRIRDGDLQARVPALKGQEAREVGRALNRTLDELRAAQERLVNAATLAAIGELSSSVVHEMRNPLSSVKMNLQALQAHVHADPTHAELAQIATRQVLRIERMLGDLLDFSKPLELDLVETALDELVAENVRAMGLEAAQRGIELRSAGPAEPIVVVMDRERIVQALGNLVRNALQALERGGCAAISWGIEEGEQPHAFLEVCDDGPGLAIDNMDRLFKPFFTTREGGTGLGLAIVKKIVELHGGRVRASQAPGGGACFRIELPILGVSP